MPEFDPTAPTTSSTVTDGVRVTCRSFYVPAESRPASNVRAPPLSSAAGAACLRGRRLVAPLARTPLPHARLPLHALPPPSNAAQSFFFGYQITIANEGTQTVKLMER